MTRTIYPDTSRFEDVVNNLKEISRLRQIEDIPDYINLPNRFVSGRKTFRVPSTPTDVMATDSIGDTVIDSAGTYQYTLVNAGGTPLWDRRTLDTSW